MRNRLIHGYDNIDYDILYQTLLEDIPPLINELKNIISSESEDPNNLRLGEKI